MPSPSFAGNVARRVAFREKKKETVLFRECEMTTKVRGWVSSSADFAIFRLNARLVFSLLSCLTLG